jgi:hypothetical protein
MRVFSILLLSSLIAITGCATSGGDNQALVKSRVSGSTVAIDELSENSYKISIHTKNRRFKKSLRGDFPQMEKYILYLAASLTLENDNKYFALNKFGGELLDSGRSVTRETCRYSYDNEAMPRRGSRGICTKSTVRVDPIMTFQYEVTIDTVDDTFGDTKVFNADEVLSLLATIT